MLYDTFIGLTFYKVSVQARVHLEEVACPQSKLTPSASVGIFHSLTSAAWEIQATTMNYCPEMDTLQWYMKNLSFLGIFIFHKLQDKLLQVLQLWILVAHTFFKIFSSLFRVQPTHRHKTLPGPVLGTWDGWISHCRSVRKSLQSEVCLDKAAIEQFQTRKKLAEIPVCLQTI